MKTVSRAADIQALCQALHDEKKTVAFVPTMGDLHLGHLALIQAAKKNADVVVASVYVNPRQFNDPKDFEKYARTPDDDLKKCIQAGVDIAFVPSDADVYPDGDVISVPLPRVAAGLEGKMRPGHFQGVVDVVFRLFQLIRPDIAVFGLKDYQQVRVIEDMVKEQKLDVKILRHTIVREKNGLAMSSRNKRLSPVARTRATEIYKALRAGEFLYNSGEKRAKKIQECVLKDLAKEKAFTVEDVSLVDAVTLDPIETIRKESLLAVAVVIEGVRLIDNCLLATS